MNRLSVIFVLFVCWVPILEGAGVPGGGTLDRAGSARALALGESCAALEGDSSLWACSPAGLATLARSEISYAFERGVAGDAHMSLVSVRPTSAGVFSASLVYFDAGDVELIDLTGASRSVTAQRDWVYGAGWSSRLAKRWRAGVNGKFYSSALAESARASAWAADAGLQWQTPVSGLLVGISGLNLGNKIRYQSEKESLPASFRAGLSYANPFGPQDLLLTGEYVDRVQETAPLFLTGVEYMIEHRLILRAGYRFSSETNKASDQPFSAGLGIHWKRFGLDYAFRPADRLSDVHLATLRVGF